MKRNGMSESELLEVSDGGEISKVKKFPNWTSEIYGLGKYIRKYGYYPKYFPLYISTDHGPAQHDKPNQLEINSSMPYHFYHSPRLVDCWKKTVRKPCEVLYSPYVFYRRKNRISTLENAKGTIAFPTHSTHQIDVMADWNEYIDQLLSLPEKYHPISVCLYFLDVQKGLYKVFFDRGIPVYCAGHWLHNNFVENFYSIIQNFKFATSNSVGSYTFYCVEMGLPFFFYGSGVQKYNRGDKNAKQGKYDNSDYLQLKKVEGLFSEITDKISPGQYALVSEELGITKGLSRWRLSVLLYKSFFKELLKKLTIQSLSKEIRQSIRSRLGIEIKRVRSQNTKAKEISRLREISNGVIFETTLLGKSIKANHSESFLRLYRELYEQGVHDFKTDVQNPFIIDCGVNIGLSIIYFKQRFPQAEIIGFEPDDNLFLIAKGNLTSMGFSDVNLIKKALWKEEGKISFFAEGTVAGRIAKRDDLVNLKTIETVRLSEYIDRKVDFLNIAIEGAEVAVLEECSAKLHLVGQLFVEYHSFAHEPQNLSRLLAILEAAGFRYVISTSKGLNSKPYLTDANYWGIDFSLNIYAYRERKNEVSIIKD